MERLLPHVQHYSWGSHDDLPGLMGAEPDGRPWAELWIGDHPRLPSTRSSTGEPLDVGLPFLLKILAAASPLSIQAHPSLEQARRGFRRENEAGIDIEAPDRTYRDENHKPELVCALTPFEALVGFRDPEVVVGEFGEVAGLQEVVDRLESGGLVEAVTWLLELDPDRASEINRAAAERFELAGRLHRQFPSDPGVVVALFLNHIWLQPGEAVFLGAGNLHAYLGGMAVEAMANSDNVVRGGFTPKHVDIDELLAVVDFSAVEPEIQRPLGPTHRYDAPVDDFSLTRVDLSSTRVDLSSTRVDLSSTRVDAGPGETFVVEAPHLVLCTEGTLQLDSRSGDHVALAPGEAAVVEAADRAFTMSRQSDGPVIGWIAGPGTGWVRSS